MVKLNKRSHIYRPNQSKTPTMKNDYPIVKADSDGSNDAVGRHGRYI